MHTSPSTEFPNCPHGPRAGTTTCLYCRNEARAAARSRRNRVLARFSLAAMGVAGVLALLVGGIIAIVPDSFSSGDDESATGSVALPTSPSRESVAATAGRGREPVAVPAGRERDPVAVPAVRPRQSVAATAGRARGSVFEPSVPEGRSALGDSIFAERAGGDVTVHFDTETLRTRFDWKFEGVVRATLPLVFGEDARIALEAIATGNFVQGGRLLHDLPTRGIRLALSDGHAVLVRPITRAGRGGPIVVGYRASAAY